MGNPKDDTSLVPLRKTLDALKEIRSALLPFLKLLKHDKQESEISLSNTKIGTTTKKRSRPNSNVDDATKKRSQPLAPHARAEAETAVALAVGTLRYMGARLRGLDQGRKKGDPLRTELDKIRGMLVALRKLESGEKEKSISGGGENSSNTSSSNDSTKRRKIVDMDAGQRMIKAALAGDNNSSSANKNISTHSSKKQRR